VHSSPLQRLVLLLLPALGRSSAPGALAPSLAASAFRRATGRCSSRTLAELRPLENVKEGLFRHEFAIANSVEQVFVNQTVEFCS